MSGADDRGALTRREFDAVIRRAAELAATDPEGGEGELTEAELYRIAGEVGLSNDHVRRALVDVRSGELEEGFIARTFGPASIRASRVIDGDRKEIAKKIDEFLVATQLLEPVRRGSTVLQYRPALDWASQVARVASFRQRKYYIASAKSVDVSLEEVDDEQLVVSFDVDPGTRKDDIAGAVFGGLSGGGGVGFLAGWALTTITPIGVAVAGGAVIAMGVGGAIAMAVGRSHKGKMEEVSVELEGVLDSLELDRSLEPPPPSWRRWVHRQFHGVAKDMRRALDDLED